MHTVIERADKSKAYPLNEQPFSINAVNVSTIDEIETRSESLLMERHKRVLTDEELKVCNKLQNMPREKIFKINAKLKITHKAQSIRKIK